MPKFLEVLNVSKVFKSMSGEEVSALKDISFSLNDGDFLTVVGPSGSGKSTLLHILAGIETVTSGRLYWSDNDQPPSIGFVFQANTVFPWRTVEANLTYALELKRVNRAQRKQRAIELCQMIGLDWDVFQGKYPKELSGGEKRRVAIGMALARRANLMLLDEPTSQLDYLTKWSMQRTIAKLAEAEEFTGILVTHDLDEAILLGDYVLILDQGVKQSLVKIELPRPRYRALLGSAKFNAYRELIMQYHSLAQDEEHRRKISQ